MTDYLVDSALWALFWFMVGCIVGWVIRGLREAKGE